MTDEWWEFFSPGTIIGRRLADWLHRRKARSRAPKVTTSFTPTDWPSIDLAALAGVDPDAPKVKLDLDFSWQDDGIVDLLVGARDWLISGNPEVVRHVAYAVDAYEKPAIWLASRAVQEMAIAATDVFDHEACWDLINEMAAAIEDDGDEPLARAVVLLEAAAMAWPLRDYRQRFVGSPPEEVVPLPASPFEPYQPTSEGESR